ncbi:MAG: hypothetical protein AAF573_19190 [Bacteroidota bacterium]
MKLKSRRYQFIFILFFVNALLLNAQTELSTSEILASAKDQYLLELQRGRVDFLRENNPKLPLMDELEFRTETNDFQVSEQEYALRARFHTKDQQRAQANFNQAQIELKSIEEQILLNELLKERYVGIMEGMYFKQLLAAKNEEKLILEDRLVVLKKSVQLPKFDILDLIDAEDELHSAERDILRLENSIAENEAQILRWTNQLGTLSENDLQLIDIEEVMRVVRSVPQDPSINHASLIKRNLNIALATREQAIRRAREENSWEFFQARIGGTDDSGFRQSFTLGLGLRIPVRNQQEDDLIALEYEKIDEKAKYEELQRALKNQMAQIRTEIENQFRLYELLGSQLEDNQAEEVLKQYQKIAGVSPLALLQLRGNRFAKELEQFRIKQDIYRLYIELLDASGKMMEMPLRNYLMASLPQF